MNCNHLGFLTIISDPIDNRGLKALLKLKWFRIGYLEFGNTNMTNDCIKLLKKASFSLKRIGWASQLHFDWNIQVK